MLKLLTTEEKIKRDIKMNLDGRNKYIIFPV